MTKRMWAAADGKLEIEGKRGSFDIAYGNASELQKLDIWLPDTEQERYRLFLLFMAVVLWRWISVTVKWHTQLRKQLSAVLRP